MADKPRYSFPPLSASDPRHRPYNAPGPRRRAPAKQREAIYWAHDGRCSICTLTWPMDKAHIDEQGILCGSCANGLRWFKDSPERLANAIKYVNARK